MEKCRLSNLRRGRKTTEGRGQLLGTREMCLSVVTVASQPREAEEGGNDLLTVEGGSIPGAKDLLTSQQP